MNITVAIIFLALALAGVVLRKTYYAVPVRELKRRAAHDPAAARLYRAVAYDSSLRSLLWLFIGLTSAASLVLLARALPVWASLLIVGPLLWVVFSLLPATRVTKLGRGLARFATPLIAWLLNYVHPKLSRAAGVVEQRYVANQHTGLFEREDLLRLIKQQKAQADNRLTSEELEIARRALSFDEHSVADILTGRKKIKTVLAGDTIGPVLIDELHKSGQDFVLVRDKKGGMVIGSLAFKQLSLESRGQVRDVMDTTVYYLHQDDSLAEALHAFFVTNHPLFIVVNSDEEFVGIVTVEAMLKQLLGHVPGDDFDQYTDPAAVAARHQSPPADTKAETDPTPKKSKDAEAPVKTDDEVIE